MTKLISLGEAMWRTRAATSRLGMRDAAQAASALDGEKVEIGRFVGAPAKVARPRIRIVGPVTL